MYIYIYTYIKTMEDFLFLVENFQVFLLFFLC